MRFRRISEPSTVVHQHENVQSFASWRNRFPIQKNTQMFQYMKSALAVGWFGRFHWSTNQPCQAKSDRGHLYDTNPNPHAPCREYLPTFPLECSHFSPNVGKYSIHGASGYDTNPNKALLVTGNPSKMTHGGVILIVIYPAYNP